jgi:hypothetical protein
MVQGAFFRAAIAPKLLFAKSNAKSNMDFADTARKQKIQPMCLLHSAAHPMYLYSIRHISLSAR